MDYELDHHFTVFRVSKRTCFLECFDVYFLDKAEDSQEHPTSLFWNKFIGYYFSQVYFFVNSDNVYGLTG
jgi:hypothetical protein